MRSWTSIDEPRHPETQCGIVALSAPGRSRRQQSIIANDSGEIEAFPDSNRSVILSFKSDHRPFVLVHPGTATFAGIPQLAVSAAAVGIPLIAPFTQFEGRRTQLNVRVGKMMRLPSNLRVQVNADVYNVLNRGDILSRNN